MEEAFSHHGDRRKKGQTREEKHEKIRISNQNPKVKTRGRQRNRSAKNIDKNDITMPNAQNDRKLKRSLRK